MEDKIKIKISEKAYNKIMELLNNHTEYECVRFSYSPGCCKSPKVSIVLDNINNSEIIDKVEELTIIYDENLLQNVREIQLVYRNNEFAVKTLSKDNQLSCNNKNSNCSSTCGSCCSKCNKNFR